MLKKSCILDVVLSALLLLMGLGLHAQETDVFESAEQQCPSLPHGLLKAISFTNTHCHHLTDANYTVPADDPTAMPRAYGMMGLVKDGKGCFRENLKTVATLSGYAEKAILEDPAINVLAYAKAFEKTALQMGIQSKAVEAYMPVIEALSELPLKEKKDELPMKMMLYSVYDYLGADLPVLFGEDYEVLSGANVSVSKDTDYPNAIWVPAPECNFEERTKEVSAVVIHYTEGSYAGCISWFQNCESSVSAHYVIRSSDGQVTQMVREKDKAWHARSANGYTIGVEHEAYGDIISFFTEAMYVSSADLMRSICARYETINGLRTFYRDTLDNGMALNTGLHDLGGENACVKIRGHQHYPDQSHTDPGPYWNWNYYYKLINERTPVFHLGGAGVTEGDLNHQNYGDDERWIWVIECDQNARISLEFHDFELETDYDFLWIYDGDNVFAPKIGRWNTQSPGTVVSSGNAFCVEFRSDCATTAAGWTAHWTAVHYNEIDEILDLDQEDWEVEVFDVLGRAVAEQQTPGVYIVRYTRVRDGRTVVKRIIR
ncbi:MAG: N-acetylmuramoyl-L-alanine amidase [Bacteroidales bacterium]|nr:N-acetylmuramoyl-L-alanine amidase [Bacteroidales bacterium]